MAILTEQFCTVILASDFLHFSHSFEKSEKSYFDYCIDEVGYVPEEWFSSLRCGKYASEADLLQKVFETCNIEMPLLTSSVCAVKSHFCDENDLDVPRFIPDELYTGNFNFPLYNAVDCTELVSKAILAAKRKFSKHSTFHDLLNCLENYCTYFSIDGGNTSFFEFLKIKAAHASNRYLLLKTGSQYDSIIVCSFDFLGIKEFKFRNVLKNDLKLMRTASLYIDIFRERFLDRFLGEVNLTRANVIFCGGRHIHLFLPNIDDMQTTIQRYVGVVNDWCVEHYKTELYVSYGYVSTSVLMLKSQNKKGTYYLELFERIASIKAEVESRKYSARNIKKINEINTSNRYAVLNETHVKKLEQFQRLMSVSSSLKVFISTCDDGLPIFPGEFISLESSNTDNVHQIYVSKSDTEELSDKEIGIWLMHKGLGKSFETISLTGKLAVFRIDIDDFRKKMLSYGKSSETHLSSSIYKMMLSKEFALFLRYYMYLLSYKYENIAVVHEGADDVFFVGNAKTLFDFSFELADAYKKYTNDKMTISGGLTLYSVGNSFLATANEAQELMNKSKMVDGKNAITMVNSLYTYKWDAVDRDQFKELLGI